MYSKYKFHHPYQMLEHTFCKIQNIHSQIEEEISEYDASIFKGITDSYQNERFNDTK